MLKIIFSFKNIYIFANYIYIIIFVEFLNTYTYIFYYLLRLFLFRKFTKIFKQNFYINIIIYFENEFFEKCILNSYIWKNWF